MNELPHDQPMAYSVSAAALLAPVSTENSSGDDLTYSPLFDTIRDARRTEDASLAQGAWETDIKTADWRQVRELCEQALLSETKDLQIAAWYAEAMVQLQGLQGLIIGIDVFRGIVAEFWESCHPRLDDGDEDNRAGKVEWLNTYLSAAARNIPMTSPPGGGYTWQQWQESRLVDNLGLKDPDAKARAIADGKLSGEQFDKSARESGADFYRALHSAATDAQQSLAALTHIIDKRFAHPAPSLRELRTALDDCAELARRLYESLGGGDRFPASSLGGNHREPATSTPQITDPNAGLLDSRRAAIQSLHNAARYFRTHEPHSPVALLAERAARWAEMSMDEWLAAVIKDEGTLNHLRELLDIRATG